MSLLLMSIVIVALGGCDVAPLRKKTGPVIGFSQVGSDQAWRQAEAISFQEEAKNRGYRIRYVDAE